MEGDFFYSFHQYIIFYQYALNMIMPATDVSFVANHICPYLHCLISVAFIKWGLSVHLSTLNFWAC